MNDIEQALAEALDHWWNWNEEDDRPRTHHAPVVDISPAAVAASLMRRPSMQAIAREAAAWRAVRRGYKAGYGYIYNIERNEMMSLEAIDPAITAALGDDHD